MTTTVVRTMIRASEVVVVVDLLNSHDLLQCTSSAECDSLLNFLLNDHCRRCSWQKLMMNSSVEVDLAHSSSFQSSLLETEEEPQPP